MRFHLAHGFFIFSLTMSSLFLVGNCWESYEMDLFDLVEEAGENFYDFFGVTQVNFI